MQISSALICHMVGYQMTWAATLKTVEVSNFFKEVPAILRKFKITLPLNILVVVSPNSGHMVVSDILKQRYRSE